MTTEPSSIIFSVIFVSGLMQKLKHVMKASSEKLCYLEVNLRSFHVLILARKFSASMAMFAQAG